MPIFFQPKCGAILVCDFSGFIAPEMIKRRPVVVISPQMSNRPRMCTIVPFSTTEPYPIEAFHYKFEPTPTLPPPYDDPVQWIKCDMIYTVSYDRLSLLANGRDVNKKRVYDQRVIGLEEIKRSRVVY
jgi:uncharacterized protein YifN (PemK superfamily)